MSIKFDYAYYCTLTNEEIKEEVNECTEFWAELEIVQPRLNAMLSVLKSRGVEVPDFVEYIANN